MDISYLITFVHACVLIGVEWRILPGVLKCIALTIFQYALMNNISTGTCKETELIFKKHVFSLTEKLYGHLDIIYSFHPRYA